MKEANIHGKLVRHSGTVYKISAYHFGRGQLISAEGQMGPEKGKVYDLRCAHPDRNSVANYLRNAIKLGLVS